MLKRIRRILLQKKYKTTGIKSKIYDFLYSNIAKFIGAWERIVEIYHFIPILYNVVTWDYSSIFYILQHWLGRMEKSIRNGNHTYAERDADKIKQALLLLDRIIKKPYEDILYSMHKEKWGESVTWITPADNDCVQFHSTKTNIVTEEDKKQERKDLSRIYKHEDYLYNQDVELLFKIIKRNHRQWWV